MLGWVEYVCTNDVHQNTPDECLSKLSSSVALHIHFEGGFTPAVSPDEKEEKMLPDSLSTAM